MTTLDTSRNRIIDSDTSSDSDSDDNQVTNAKVFYFVVVFSHSWF